MAVIAALVSVATGGLRTAAAADAPLYSCPLDVELEDTALCGNGSLLALIPLISQSADTKPLAVFLEKEIVSARKNRPAEAVRHPASASTAGHFYELAPYVQTMRAFPNTFVLRFSSGLATRRRLNVLTGELCTVLSRWRVHGASSCQDATTTVRLEPTFKLHAYAGPPDDPHFVNDSPAQWNLQDDAGIKARAAWDRAGTVTDLPSVRVAVVDTGTKPIPLELDNGLLVDGADFTPFTPVLGNPVAGGDHGTEVASVIAARTNNGNSMAGVAWTGTGQGSAAKLIPIKIMSSAQPTQGEQCTNNLLHALPYVVDPHQEVDAGSHVTTSFWDLTKLPDPLHPMVRPAKGARIVNLSLGYERCSTALGEAFRRIAQFFPDVLFVVAVPNGDDDPTHSNMDASPANRNYPTSYRWDNILSVTETGEDHCVYGKFGTNSVDLAAPGISVVVLKPSRQGSQTDDGTSFAAPQVSGAAALLKALAPPDWGYAQVREYLQKSVNNSSCNSPDAGQSCGSLPTVCSGTAHGLLDLDAATGPPVNNITALSSSGGPAAAWTTAKPATVSWQRAFPSGQCTQIDIDLVVDNATGGAAAAKLSAAPVDVDSGSAQFDAATLAAAASAAMPTGSEPAQARVRLQCVGSHMFRTSQDFTLRRAQ